MVEMDCSNTEEMKGSRALKMIKGQHNAVVVAVAASFAVYRCI
jgi:hypothetical protein